MERKAELAKALSKHPRLNLVRQPILVEPLSGLGADLGIELYIKRDDETGIAFCGNKLRQLEFYFGAARDADADTVLITGAVQSNFVRATATVAARLGMSCHIQLEERVADVSPLYRSSGNVLLSRLLGAKLHSYPKGEDEAGADNALGKIAEGLRSKGRRPYIIPLSGSHPPLGALGYVAAALEFAAQSQDHTEPDEIFIASGSGLTHAGLLFGLRFLGLKIPVRGICVRRGAAEQAARVARHCAKIAELLAVTPPVRTGDILLSDQPLAPGYGQISPDVQFALRQAAQREGVFLDPVYTGKVMAGLICRANSGEISGKSVLFWHTGGQAALFAYGDQIAEASG
jgi:D-cysteine desulfhydrase family pyridoxal phosphate-dependent enzyme